MATALNRSILLTRAITHTHFQKSPTKNEFTRQLHNPITPSKKSKSNHANAISKLLCTHAESTTLLTQELDPFKEELSESTTEETSEKFDWYSEWYAVAPVCDLDKRVPHGFRIIGLDLVVWWDRNQNAWKVFDDRCPHRLAPLSDGRIDQWGRLQCVYHGWCFNGSGKCDLIPQAPLDGPPVHTSKRACVASYPCTVQNGILWFWPNSDPMYQDILAKKKPPYIEEIDDPSFSSMMTMRDMPYGYEIMVENLMDPAHLPYAHYGIMRLPTDKNRPKADREGGRPLEINVQTIDKSGYFAVQERSVNRFIAPCVLYSSPKSTFNSAYGTVATSDSVKESQGKQKRLLLIFICIPVSPGRSRLIFTFPRNFAVWIDQIVPRWVFHIGQNLILDSDLYLLHVEERKIMEIGPSNWQKTCYVPTKSDALIVAFRRWLKKYAGGQVDWRHRFDGSVLPPTPPREQLMDRNYGNVIFEKTSPGLIPPASNCKLKSMAPALNHSILLTRAITNTHFQKSPTKNEFSRQLHHPITPSKSNHANAISKLHCTHAESTTLLTQELDPFKEELSESTTEETNENFDWYSEWYAVAPLCDLDKRVPHGFRIIGLDLVIWWDRTQNAWKVFDDRCPHRLAPLSDGRIDQWGRLQCVYHGWCFNGSGKCDLIPQATLDGPPVHTSKRACVASYPCTVQNGILWFWPNSDPMYQGILAKKQPPYIKELDDPSFSSMMTMRDMPYGYEIMVENLVDPAHVPYAHYGILRVPTDKNRPKADREGGGPLEINVQTIDKSGFFAVQERSVNRFIAPCVLYSSRKPTSNSSNGTIATSDSVKESQEKQRRLLLIFICIPVSPGRSRLIFTFPRNFGVWLDQIVPRWVFHIGQNLILDSDLYLLHVEERKIMEAGPSNWHKACYVPTKSDALILAFRRWLKKYAGGQVDWRHRFDGSVLPPTPPREQLMDRYWTHVVKCSSCSAAYKGLNVAETVLQIISIGLIGIVGVTKQGAMTTFQRSALFTAALLCFAASRWLSHFIYKNFHFHDYNHALR